MAAARCHPSLCPRLTIFFSSVFIFAGTGRIFTERSTWTAGRQSWQTLSDASAIAELDLSSWESDGVTVRGRRKRPYKPSSLCRDRPSSIPSLLGAVFPHGRPSGLGAFPAIAGQRSEVWWQPPDCRVVPLPLPRPQEPSPNRNLQRPHLIRFKTSDLFAFYVIFDETTCPALSISQHSDGVRVLPVCTVQ
jgi:hypothetical protein